MSTLSLNVALERPGFSLAVDQTLEIDGITALFGPSGSGKTTLLRVIAGLERTARGTVKFDGDVWQDGHRRIAPHRRRIGYVFQDGRLFPHLSVEQNLRFAVRRATAESPIGFDDAVEALDLKALLARRPASLSGGEQQRVAIARALLASPKLLLMDEPLSSLDVARKREILAHIERLPHAFRVPVLYVTHNVDEVARLASDVVLLTRGHVDARGTVEQVFERIDLKSYADGLEPGAVLRTRVAGHHNGITTLTIGKQHVRVPMIEAPVGAARPVRVHARDVAIATVRPQGLSIRNILAATILRIDGTTSGNVELLLDVDGEHLRSRITRDALDELRLATGQSVFALVKSVALESTLLG